MKKILIITVVAVLMLSMMLAGLTGCESKNPIAKVSKIVNKEIGSIAFYSKGQRSSILMMNGKEFGYKSSTREGYLIKENGALVVYIKENDIWTKYSDQATINRQYDVKIMMLNLLGGLSTSAADYSHVGEGVYSHKTGAITAKEVGDEIEVKRDGIIFAAFIPGKPNLVIAE